MWDYKDCALKRRWRKEEEKGSVIDIFA